MKQLFAILCLWIACAAHVYAQHEEESENGIVSLAGKEGFTIGSKKGDFLFKPYLLVQASAKSTITMTRGWMRPITKTISPTPASPFPMRSWDSRVRHSTK